MTSADRILRNLPVSLQRAMREGPKDDGVDRSVWDWYGESCPCGLEAGQCKVHPRARLAQRPPEGDWQTWAYIAGRGTGKTYSAARWLHDRVEQGLARSIMLIAPIAADIRDVMIEGPSGLLNTAPPWNKPKYEPSKRRLTWKNGASAVCIAGEEPERARGHNVDTIWADELPIWAKPQETWDNASLALRVGPKPQALVSTTPRSMPVLRSILESKTTVKTSESSYANRKHLAPAFFDQIIARFEGTNLGRQEIYAEMLSIVEGAWFSRFDPLVHITDDAEYHPSYSTYLGIDCGTSMTTAAAWIQVIPVHDPNDYRAMPTYRVHVFADYNVKGLNSAQNATDIFSLSEKLPCRGRVDAIRVDPASIARSGLGPAAFGEYEKIFGSTRLAKAPSHRVVDGLDFMDCLLDQGNLLIHSRAVNTINAFKNYRRKKATDGTYLNEPVDPQSPEEDSMDALRYIIRDRFPEGRIEQKNLRGTHYSVGI